MKKTFSLLLALLLALALAGCADPSKTGQGGETGKLNIVCTIFPEYDWVRQILGDSEGDATLTLLLDSGVDLHSYQPTADDIIKVSSCDLFIYVGGESEAWIEDALSEAANRNMTVINLLDVLGGEVKEEELVEGMEAADEPAEADETEYDEHVWLSLRNAETFVTYIAAQLAALEPDNAAAYAANAEAYISELKALDAEYKETVDSASRSTLVFGDRFPFRYLVDDYKVNYFAAFAGCSAETEASFRTVAFLAGKVDELSLPCVMTMEGTDHSIAETIIKNTAAKDQAILTMDSMQSTTGEDAANGVTYLSVMRSNLETLREALN